MGIDINYQPIKDSDITYYWWCQDCLDYHASPWCPWKGPLCPLKDVEGEKVLVYDLCPHCGQVICR